MKHAKKNLFGLIAIAVAILALAAVPFFAQLNAQNANADELSPQECDTLSNAKTTMEDDILACYEAFGKAYNYGYGIYMLSEIMSDECLAGGGVNDGQRAQIIERFDKTLTRDNKDLLNTEWVNYYDTIRLCNKFLEKYPETGEMTEDYLACRGEAYVLRALCYFDLVRLFGHIPLVLKTTDVPNVQADAEKEVFPQLCQDLRNAVNMFPNKSFFDLKDTCHRLNKWSTEAFLARVWLYYSGFFGHNSPLGSIVLPDGSTMTKQDVIAYIDDAANNSRYSLVSDFRKLWPSTAAYGRHGEPYYVKAEDGDIEALLGLGTEDPVHYSKENEENMFSIGYESDTYSDKNQWQGLIGPRLARHNFIGKAYGMLPATPNLVMDWANGEPQDMRRVASITDLVNGETFGGKWDANLVDWRECTTYQPNKYYPLSYESGLPTNYYGDFYLMRFADVLLMQAELKEDVTGINMVRERAGLSPIGSYSLNALQDNRRWEFAFEGIRYFDLWRWYVSGVDPLAVPALDKQNRQMVIDGGEETMLDYRSADGTLLSARLVETHGYMPIPETQIAKYHYKQNPGW